MDIDLETLSAQDEDAVHEEDDFLRSAWPGLVRLGRLLTGSQQRGEDLAQEAILGLLRNAPVAEPTAYLRRSIVNLSTNAGRREGRERAFLKTLRDEVVRPPETDDLWPLSSRCQRASAPCYWFTDLQADHNPLLVGTSADGVQIGTYDPVLK